MKTAMQEFINDTLEGKAKELEHYIEKEKQMIIDAYNDAKSSIVSSNPNVAFRTSEQYYNETFKQ